MRIVSAALALWLAASPLAAEEVAPHGDGDAPPSLIEDAAKLFLEGLLDEMEPAMRDLAEEMEEFALTLEPMLRDLARMMGDMTAYHAPEMLPNGDIIIRRKRPDEVRPGPGGEIEISL